jgi:hypothetical protein
VIDIQVAGDADIAEVQRLFREYASRVGVDLGMKREVGSW